MLSASEEALLGWGHGILRFARNNGGEVLGLSAAVLCPYRKAKRLLERILTSVEYIFQKIFNILHQDIDFLKVMMYNLK